MVPDKNNPPSSSKVNKATAAGKPIMDEQWVLNQLELTSWSDVSSGTSSASGSSSSTMSSSLIGQSAANKKPVCELRGKRWYIENQTGMVLLEEGKCTIKHTVYIYNCTGATIQLPGKILSITIDKCTKTNVVFNSVIGSCELVNCKQTKVQVKGQCEIITIDMTDGCVVYAGKSCFKNLVVVASKSSEVNLSWPGTNEDDAWNEASIPVQWQHKIVDGKVTTSRYLCGMSTKNVKEDHDDDNDKDDESDEADDEEEDSATTIKRVKLENNELKKEVKEQARQKEEEEERKQRNKQSFKCCVHINESGFTKLQPNDRNTDEPSRYNAYSDECKGFGNEGPRPVHFSQGSYHYLEWQCGCRNCWEHELSGDFFTLLCSECEEEKLHPTPTCGSFAGEGCGRKESDCGELRGGMCGACITCDLCGKKETEVGTLDDDYECSTCTKKEQEEEEERKREEEEEEDKNKKQDKLNPKPE